MPEEFGEKYKERLFKIMEESTEIYHFYYSIDDDMTVPLNSGVFPRIKGDMSDFLFNNGMVSEKSMQLLSLFRDKIRDGIKNGIDRSQERMEIYLKISDSRDHGKQAPAGSSPMRQNREGAFPAGDEYTLCHLIGYFLRDEQKKITDIHYVLHPFTASERYNHDAMRSFSADKNPRAFAEKNARIIVGNPDKEVAFIQFDIEHFRFVNNKFGSERGDELLQFIGDSLNIICTEQQSFRRLNSDVFMLVTTFTDREGLVKYIRDIEKKLSGYKDMEYRFAFGVSIVDDRTHFTRRFGDNAAAARQSIKGNAINNLCFFDEDMKSEIEKRQSIEEDMQEALDNGDFIMYLQPKHSIKTGKIIGAEALARWKHPEKGMISPADFIPVFEKNGFIIKLDMYIWEAACKKIREWLDNGIEPVPISVNISREYIRTVDVTNIILDLVHKYDIPIALLELEITESAESSGAAEAVKKMKEAGFKMLMDDFGSGYSSLNMLKSTPFDVLKIDKNFLDEFMESDRGRKIIEHTISMSRDIGIDIIAEGVETYEQAEFLSGCGCDSAQGFYYSRPLPADEFNKRLAEINKKE